MQTRFSDESWKLIEPVFPAGGQQGRPRNDRRLTLEAICWRFRTRVRRGVTSWHVGAWYSVWERHRRWSDDGTHVSMFAAAPERDEQMPSLLSVDSTIARADPLWVTLEDVSAPDGADLQFAPGLLCG